MRNQQAKMSWRNLGKEGDPEYCRIVLMLRPSKRLSTNLRAEIWHVSETLPLLRASAPRWLWKDQEGSSDVNRRFLNEFYCPPPTPMINF